MKIYFTKIIIITLFTAKCFGQVDVTVQSLQYTNNGEPTENASSCETTGGGIIHLESSTSTTIDFGINLSKPNGQVVGTSTISIYTKKSSSDFRIQHGSSITVLESSWNHPTSGNDTFSTSSGTFSINASDFNVSGGTLYVVFKTSSDIEYESCKYSIEKDPIPTFELANDSYSIPCGSTSNYTFTVNNVYNSAGTLSYSWNVGTGWKRNGFSVSGTITTSTNGITLVPNSTTVLPSNVSVTTTLDGQTYGTETATINRSNIAQTITSIYGPSTLCSGTTAYNFGQESVVSGQSVSWSSSDTSIATLSNATNTGVSLTQIGSGEVTLTATISNGCGQSYSRTKTMFAGGPPAFAVARGTAQSEYCDTKYHYVPFTISDKSSFLNYNVSVIGMPSSTVSSFTNDGFILKFNKNYSGWVDFIVSASNSCGSIGTYREEYIGTCSALNSFSMQKASNNKSISIFKAYPNPSSNVVYLDVVDVNNIPKKNAQIKASLYDLIGFEKEKVLIKDNKATISVATLPKGLYVLRVTINDEIETHLISVK